jgi:hypothetical protein
MAVYDKDEALDLITEEKKALKAAIESELAARAVRRVRQVDRGGDCDG